jgi:cephalosporin hydroxylase
MRGGKKSVGTLARSRFPRLPMFLDRERSALPARTLHQIQKATFRYSFAGIACLKNPFDLALYSMLISRVRPRTIVEIGSHRGGSAVWFASMARGLGLDCRVVSVDINAVTDVDDPDVTFIAGDAHDLASSELPQLLEDASRPWLVVEDGPHTEAACLAVMRFFDHRLESGEYLIVEDGILKDLRYRHLRNGPNRAIRRFLREAPGRFDVDRELCDFYGRNVTWNTNGYLRRR